MRTIGVMTSSAMQIRILASTLRAITKMVDEHEVLMVLVVLGVEKMNIDILSGNYDKKCLHFYSLVLAFLDGTLVLSKWMITTWI
jgi:hypothetical protein